MIPAEALRVTAHDCTLQERVPMSKIPLLKAELT
jgi:hypothetical protein